MVDLSKAAGSPVLTFDHALNFFADIATAVKEVSVWAREEGGAWQQLSGITMPAQLSWTFVGSGNVSLSALFAGKKIRTASNIPRRLQGRNMGGENVIIK